MKLFLSAGEASGDLHAANLIRQIKAIRPDAEFVGLGGPRMEEAGCKCLVDMVAHSGMWFMHLWKNFFRFLGILHKAVRSLEEDRPDAVVLVDNPGFNVRLALHAKERGIPVIYYIAPQTWAWGSWRIKKMSRRIDRMLVILPFEAQFWKRFGVDARFVGHPLFDQLDSLRLPRDVARDRNRIGLLPGSRITEVEKLLPIMLGAARIIRDSLPAAKFSVACAGGKLEDVVDALAARHAPDLDLEKTDVHHVIRSSAVCVTASGTATLELAYFGTPMVVLYRVVWYGLPVCPIFVSTEYISLINILAGREVVPELCLFSDNSRLLAREVLGFLRDPKRRERCAEEMRRVVAKIGRPGASAAAAEAVIEFVQERRR